MAGAPEGNKNSSRDNRLWANTIRRAVMQADGEKLRRIADALLTKAEEGDISAIKEIGDRLDGKALQAVEQKTELVGEMQHTVTLRPQLTKEEWMQAHGLGTAARPTE